MGGKRIRKKRRWTGGCGEGNDGKEKGVDKKKEAEEVDKEKKDERKKK